MLRSASETVTTAPARLGFEFAHSAEAVGEAQALRYRVFVEEMGARIADKVEGAERDIFDPHCDHLLVRDHRSGEVVGTYRILAPSKARAIGGFYSDEEFDLTRLAHLRDEMVELGRSCVHPEYRNGATIALLWSGIAQYMSTRDYRYLIGCASVPLADGGAAAARVWQQVQAAHLGPIEWRVFPRCPLPPEILTPRAAGAEAGAALPPLIKGYLRAGGQVCGEPAWDPDFNTADLFMLLPMERLNRRHAARFMGA